MTIVLNAVFPMNVKGMIAGSISLAMETELHFMRITFASYSIPDC